MAKVLKFGLMLDDCNVRSLEGLQEHFVIEDVLKYFEDGTLSRWLKVWGYKEQLAAVEAIDKALDKKDIVLQLANIFGIEDVEPADIEKALSVFSYLDKKQKFQVTIQENALFKKQAVEEYLAGYEALIQDMINKVKVHNKVSKKDGIDDIEFNVNAFREDVREDVRKLEQDYLPLVKLSFSELCFRFQKKFLVFETYTAFYHIILVLSESKILEKLFKESPCSEVRKMLSEARDFVRDCQQRHEESNRGGGVFGTVGSFVGAISSMSSGRSSQGWPFM